MVLVKFSPPLVVKIRDRIAEKHGRRSGNYVKTVLSIVFAWGKERGLIKSNPAADIKALKRSKNAPYVNRPWKDHEREAVLAALPDHMRLPIWLMMFCGLDPQDALLLPKSALDDGRINTRRSKTRVGVWMPIPPAIAHEIESSKAMASASTMLCVNSKGQPWTVSGFRASWRKIKCCLEKEGVIGLGLTLKGLRHTVATILAEIGMDERTIADVLGQKTIEMARHYSRSADKSKKVEAAVIKLGHAMNKKRVE
ncbi:tyrosine-type recombinase/integrase [Bartonella sp. DGB2]|uniref:tyrosine-type recombinase/integrase n=1 Tax=Bartonella sp. DGB2 TaxID=3388426 RepID=UPI00398F99F7